MSKRESMFKIQSSWSELNQERVMVWTTRAYVKVVKLFSRATFLAKTLFTLLLQRSSFTLCKHDITKLSDSSKAFAKFFITLQLDKLDKHNLWRNTNEIHSQMIVRRQPYYCNCWLYIITRSWHASLIIGRRSTFIFFLLILTIRLIIRPDTFEYFWFVRRINRTSFVFLSFDICCRIFIKWRFWKQSSKMFKKRFFVS